MFEAVDCLEERRVEIATFYLQQEADNWWSMMGPMYRQEGEFRWTDLKARMRDRFYPEHVKSAKYEEFLHLRQGTTSIQDYYAKYLELARFVPALAPDEPSKARKFVSGLNFETQKAVCVFECQTLGEAYSKAAKHYRIQQMQKEVREKVVLRSPKGKRVSYKGAASLSDVRLISMAKMRKYVGKRCEVFLCMVEDLNVEKKGIEQIPVVREFPDIFPEEIPGFPPQREVEFTLDLVPGTTPISKTPY
ncbi:uncharacterized protein LOC116022416 [Ipomoea triloba]|uniref:uncharacterized protein LOC116022416 n=1 Tax=Ipomoea triloba TaxID=35885 RepID=UPI00125E329F|nr:uncharacterized protein LOC116022416 [Ipomoea triloba]